MGTCIHGEAKTSQTKLIPSTGVSPQGITMTTKAKISQHENTASVFFHYYYYYFLRSDPLLKIPTIIISRDNNLYSINYLYCTIISPATKGGASFLFPFLFFFQSKAFNSQFLLRPQFSGVSAERTEADRQQASFFLLRLSCTEIKQDIQQKTKLKKKQNKKQ